MDPRGATEIQMEMLHKYVDKDILNQVQICTSIPGKVPIDPNKVNILWQKNSWDQPNLQEFFGNKARHKEYDWYVFNSHWNYEKFRYFFDVPSEFHDDLAMFMDGKYSKFSSRAKRAIRKYSRLPYRQGANGEVKKSVWYHVLEKSDKLRASLEKKFDCDFLDSAELASKPTKNNFFHNI